MVRSRIFDADAAGFGGKRGDDTLVIIGASLRLLVPYLLYHLKGNIALADKGIEVVGGDRRGKARTISGTVTSPSGRDVKTARHIHG